MPLDRRIILRESARALTFALLAFGTLTCQVHNAEDRSVPPSTPTLSTWPNTLEGRVLEVDGGTLFVAWGNEKFRLTTSAATLVWDGIPWVADVPTRVDDFVFAQGIWKRDHSFDARKLYVNIVNLRGETSDVTPRGESATFLLADQYQHTDTIAIFPLTEIYEGTGTKFTYEQEHLLPSNGSYVEVIGRKMADGSIMAVNITLSSSQSQSDPTAEAEESARQEAIRLALVVGQSWGERNPQVVGVRRESHEDFLKQMELDGETVVVAGTSDLWVVDLQGTFVPRRVLRDVTWHCDAMFVAIQSANNEVIGAGCRDTIFGTATTIGLAPAGNSSPLPFFPRQKDPHPDSMAALLVGKLVVADSCIRVNTSTGRSFLPIWPLTYSLRTHGSAIEVVDGNGQFVGRIGEEVRLGGGIMTGDITRYLLEALPQYCRDPYWIVATVPVR